jgi:putative MATE family efflux protein
MSSETAGAVVTPTELKQPPETLFGLIRASLAGEEFELTSGPVGRAVLLLAVPMVLEMVMESIFAVVDAFFVSRLGVAAVAAVGLTEAMMTILYAVALGLAMATTAMVARRIGEKNPEAAARAGAHGIALGLGAAGLMGIPAAIFAPELLAFMGADATVVGDGAIYTRILFGGSGTVLLIFLINAVFRGAGDAALAMRTLWLANAINIVLDPCLIFGLGPFPEMGLAGAATATTIGRGVGVLYQLWCLAGTSGRIRIELRHLKPRLDVARRLLRVSVGGVFQILVATSSWMVMVRIVGSFGAEAVAGYTIAIRIVIFALLPSWGLANSAATLMGQNLGAKKPERAERSVWTAGLLNMGFLLAVAVVFLIWPEPLIRIFLNEPEAVAFGVNCLRIIAAGYGFYAWGMVIVQAFNGAGDTRTPTVINLVSYWLVQIPLAAALAHHTWLAVNGVYVAIAFAEALLAVIGVLVFRRGTWRSQEI